MPKPNSRASNPAKSTPVLGWIVIISLAIAAAYFIKQPFHNIIVDDDKKEVIVDDVKPAGLKDCVLAVVYDKKVTNQNVDYQLTLQDDIFWFTTAPALVRDVERIQVTDDLGKQLITMSSVPAPFVMLFNTKTKKQIWTIPLPKGGTSEIAKRLK